MNTTTNVIITCITLQVIAIGATICVYSPQLFRKLVPFPWKTA